MSKINYHRGESREFVRRRDPGAWGRKRHASWGFRRSGRHRASRGRGGLLAIYREVGGTRIGPNNWCPCCVDATWDRGQRNASSRRRGKRIVHKGVRAAWRELLRGWITAGGLQETGEPRPW